jgi:transcription regulator
MVGAYHTVQEVAEHVHDHTKPPIDVVLLDLRLSDNSCPHDNINYLHELDLAVLIFSAYESPYLTRQALTAGVDGIVEKSTSSENIIQAINAACSNPHNPVTSWLATNCVPLSPRQREVLELYALGEPAKRVASLTGLSVETVNDYLSRIRTKYAQAGRPTFSKVDLVLRALEDGLIPGPRDVRVRTLR